MEYHSYEEIFHSNENEFIERKESLTQNEKICATICAFSNDIQNSKKTRYIIIGQKDDLSCAGQNFSDKEITTIASWCRDGLLQPIISPSINHHIVNGCEIIIIKIIPSFNTPVRYKGKSYVRIGSTTRLASAEDERILSEKRRSKDIPFDARGINGASIDDLDMVRFKIEYLPLLVHRDVLEQNGRSQEQQLRALRLIDAESLPTASALLFLGKNPQEFFPGAYIQALRINGTKLTDEIIDNEEIRGTLTDQIRRMEEKSDIWSQTASFVGNGRRLDKPDYPKRALEQIIRNAILHRSYEDTFSPVRLTWYNDRIEITSPGGPFGGVTPENFGQPSATAYRNPTIAEALKAYGYVEKFGYGLCLAREELEKNGNPELDFLIPPPYSFITSILRR